LLVPLAGCLLMLMLFSKLASGSERPQIPVTP
jgi:hypothetical protein